MIMTFIELLTLCFTISLPVAIGLLLARRFGLWVGIAAGLFLATVNIITICLLYRARWRRQAQKRQECREKYTHVYRILALPSHEGGIKKAQGAEIRVGDCGWEAAPLRDDGLIYLQGLNSQWRVIWYAGFRPDQIEKVAPKPQSQYDWNNTWVKEPPSCPFPVQEHFHPTINMGFPMPVTTKH
jgi:hypothetical protein